MLKSSEKGNIKFELKGREMQYTIPTIEYRFRFDPPKPNKERLIVQRDALGRIIHSKPPELRV